MTPCVLDLSTVHDASAKLPAGLLNGNVNQYGDIDLVPQGEVALAGSGSSHQGPLLPDDHGPPPV